MTTTLRPEDCLAIIDGETAVEGLDGPVHIVRDRWGIPHIKATTTRDAFFAQGFCVAQDRAFQIELWRRMAHGASAAMLNRGLLQRDVQNRRLGYGRLAAAEWDAQSEDARMVLQAYADGVNAAIATQPEPWEFRHLGHHMEPWSPVDSLAVIKMVNAGAQWASKLRFGQIHARLGEEAVRALVPDIPKGAAVITPSGARWERETHPFVVDPESAMGQPDGPGPSGGGSNCWVVSGAKTASGAPMVAGDPHLAISVPGQWYVLHMECPEFTVAGATSLCYPGPVFYGHNTKVAWTMTHGQGDRYDVYRERIRRGADGPAAEFRGEWAALQRLDERFDVRDGDPETRTVWLTRHGPVIFGDPEQDDEVLSVRWGLEAPAHDMDAMIGALRATNVDEARAAFHKYDSVSGNFCFADAGNHIGYQYTGRLPKRPGWLLPVPGWDGEHEWDGDIPREELPAEDDPPNGFFVTANNRTVPDGYPHYLSYMSTRYRADRLREVMDDIEQFDLEVVRALQGERTSIHAREMAARFAAVTPDDAGARALQALFRGWDGLLDVDSAAALAYALACDALVGRTVRAYYAQVPNVTPNTPAEEYRIVHEQVMAERPLMLMGHASWDAAIVEALAKASRVGRERHGDDLSTWRWGDEHRIAWAHNLGRDPELAEFLNPGAFEVGGDGMTPYNTQTERGAASTHGVSFRQVLDLADLDAAQICIPPGNSGQPGSPHYADNIERWRDVEYHPLLIRWPRIEEHAEAVLELRPARA